jgi:predicted metal-dependent enzyme (double-stranded beta helix superfamily)
MHISMRVMTGAAAAAVLGLSAWAPAQADPTNAKNALQLTVPCDNGHTYSVVTNGSGAWTPAHDLNSTATLIPVSFGEETFTIYAPDGTVVDQETQAPTAKAGASAHNKHATLSCTFSGSQTAPDGSMFVISGSVVGFVTT